MNSEILDYQWEKLMDQLFGLMYQGKLSYQDVLQIPTDERLWLLNRLNKQIEKENDQIKNAQNV